MKVENSNVITGQMKECTFNIVDYGRKWYFPIISVGIFLVFNWSSIRNNFFWPVILSLIAAHFFFYWLMENKGRDLHYNILWYLTFMIDLGIISSLILYSNGLDSCFVIAYGIVMVSVGIFRSNPKEVILSGLLGHLAYATTLFFYYKSFGFYISEAFWTQCLLLSGIFINTVLITRIIQQQQYKLKEAKEELEGLTKDLKEANKELEKISCTDGVTGIHNHRYFQERLEQEVERCNRYGYPVALLMLDLDNFKTYNDTFGHPCGDEVLKQVADILENNVRSHDIVARYGGDEFAIILIDNNKKSALQTGKRIREAITNYNFEEEEKLDGILTISIGIAVCPTDADSTSDLVEKADQALYEAKSKGKNAVRFYHSSFQD